MHAYLEGAVSCEEFSKGTSRVLYQALGETDGVSSATMCSVVIMRRPSTSWLVLTGLSGMGKSHVGTS